MFKSFLSFYALNPFNPSNLPLRNERKCKNKNKTHRTRAFSHLKDKYQKNCFILFTQPCMLMSKEMIRG